MQRATYSFWAIMSIAYTASNKEPAIKGIATRACYIKQAIEGRNG